MMLVGNQRGGARDLAVHLMKPENEHIELYELRGFAAQSLAGALNEAYALSRGTKCRQFLYSLSVNPPEKARVATTDFIKAIDRAEMALGLDGQSRAIVFHEKKGRRHAHVVWSRIDVETMKAVPLPFTKRKLVELTRDLFVEHGWKMPDGLIDPARRNPRNFTLAEWQHAKRQGKDPRAIKAALQDAWTLSDSPAALKAALDERGFKLARGHRRAFVVIDHNLEVYALHKWLGLKVRDVRERLGKVELPSVDNAKAQMARDMKNALDRIADDVTQRHTKAAERFEARRTALVARQRKQRAALRKRHAEREALENKLRQSRFRKGLSGLWDRLRGEHRKTANFNAREAERALKRDRDELDRLISHQLAERQRLRLYKYRLSEGFERTRAVLAQDRQRYERGPEP
ncbi:MAG: relaxase/mobilization nuclease domain-containing protein [Alphaproteobacteria bacterium]|nr:relaxase/mobilization nuclease domain-containing protein [Alphaproteobacteria bacterium]